MVVINLIIQLGWNYSNSFIIGKKFAYVLIVLYLVFFSGSLVFGILTRGD